MTKDVVYYHWHLGSSKNESNFFEDFKISTLPKDFCRIINQSLEETDVNYEHFNCPAFKAWNKNTWVVNQPFDMSFIFNSADGTIKHLPTGESGKNYFVIHQSYKIVKYPEIQFKYFFLFWTTMSNIWIDIYPHPEASRIGLDLIPGTFPISNWIRPVSFAFKLRTPDLQINMKKDQPLYYIKFIDKNNYERKINLEESEKVPDNILSRYYKESNIKAYSPMNSWKFIKNRLFNNKCPFKA